MKLTVIRPLCPDHEKTKRLNDVLEFGLEGIDCDVLETVEEIEAVDRTGRRLLFAIERGESGINLEYVRLLKSIRLHRDMFDGCLAGIVVDGNSELFTKEAARDLALAASAAGCTFPGKALVEGTGSLFNQHIQAKQRGYYRQPGPASEGRHDPVGLPGKMQGQNRRQSAVQRHLIAQVSL